MYIFYLQSRNVNIKFDHDEEFIRILKSVIVIEHAESIFSTWISLKCR